MLIGKSEFKLDLNFKSEFQTGLAQIRKLLFPVQFVFEPWISMEKVSETELFYGIKMYLNFKSGIRKIWASLLRS